MKKLVLLLLVSFCTIANAQTETKLTEVLIKKIGPVEITGEYRLINEKKNKKEYEIKVFFLNTHEKDIVIKAKTDKFARVTLKNNSSYVFTLLAEKSGDGTIKIPAGKKLEANYFYEKWYKDGQVPEFVFIEESK